MHTIYSPGINNFEVSPLCKLYLKYIFKLFTFPERAWAGDTCFPRNTHF